MPNNTDVHYITLAKKQKLRKTCTTLKTSLTLILVPILMRMPLMLDFLRPTYDSRMFWGFRSRWMIPLLLRMRMAAAICWRKTLSVSSLSVPLAKAEIKSLKSIKKFKIKHQRAIKVHRDCAYGSFEEHVRKSFISLHTRY